MDHVRRNFPCISQDVIKAYSSLGAATVYEANGKLGGMDCSIRPIAWNQHICGTALTVACHPGDNLMLHAALAIAQPGDVIVAQVGNLLDAGYWGEITTAAAQAQGVAGLVIGGGIRDRDAIVKRGFPIWSAAICMRGTAKSTLGYINSPIVVGGVPVSAGDLVLADDDGVVIVPHDRLEGVLQKAIAKASEEAGVMEMLETGKLTIDLLGFRKSLQDNGVYV